MAAKGQLSRKRPTCLNLLKNRVQPYKVMLQKPYKAEQLILICLQRHLFSAARKECAEKK